ncbi:alpha/beta fold hydrolase [Novipirellula artificiosorum]|uniref:Alpha/beta hydrolase family protein n=1 Tax=Novipirellula artificiosorum TaxID=2528016 RepID=A0A5C6DLV5_9BACT|nr:alpha/beta hydrolase [Novipirellula artificiosorum]TWU37124.1 Alpha/beta hydrolase family protein [Novipirellula artificiosorum]
MLNKYFNCFFAGVAFFSVPSFVGAGERVPAGRAFEIPEGPEVLVDDWHGYRRHSFVVDGCPAFVVEPKEPMLGNPWIWSMMFPDSFYRRVPAHALLGKGFYYAYIDTQNRFGCPDALEHCDAFYAFLTDRGLSKRVTLSALSRGGLYAYGWARQNAEKTLCIYADAAVCDFKSWPGGKMGKGMGNKQNWEELKKCYRFPGDAEALAWPHNPVDSLQPLADAKIPLIHVTGDSDRTVPMEENTEIVQRRYEALGGDITVFRKPGGDHHPHGLDDPAPVIELILHHYEHERKNATPRSSSKE